jgi:hypothetical protein
MGVLNLSVHRVHSWIGRGGRVYWPWGPSVLANAVDDGRGPWDSTLSFRYRR